MLNAYQSLFYVWMSLRGLERIHSQTSSSKLSLSQQRCNVHPHLPSGIFPLVFPAALGLGTEIRKISVP